MHGLHVQMGKDRLRLEERVPEENSELTADQRFEILMIEMQLIQGVFNKYDNMIFSSRNWFVTVWTGTIGLGLTANLPTLIPMAALLAVLYWVLEGLMRHQYWHKYVIRYRAIRTALNATPPRLEQLSTYDLTHHFGNHPSEWRRLQKSFLKTEPLVLYSALAVAALVLWRLVLAGVIAPPRS